MNDVSVLVTTRSQLTQASVTSKVVGADSGLSIGAMTYNRILNTSGPAEPAEPNEPAEPAGPGD